MTSCVVWGNEDSCGDETVGAQITSEDGELTVTFSDVQGDVLPGEGNISVDPEFLDAEGRIGSGSPLVNAGDSCAVPPDSADLDDDEDFDEPAPDRDLSDRITGRDVDMGAFEVPTCLGDLNTDGSVAFADLLVFLVAWGPCPQGCHCAADFNGSGNVGFDDLLVFLAAWGPCPQPEPISLEDALEEIGLNLDDWDTLQDILSNGTQAEKDNALCWMEHYVHGCDPLFCSFTCPDDDPFGGH